MVLGCTHGECSNTGSCCGRAQLHHGLINAGPAAVCITTHAYVLQLQNDTLVVTTNGTSGAQSICISMLLRHCFCMWLLYRIVLCCVSVRHVFCVVWVTRKFWQLDSYFISHAALHVLTCRDLVHVQFLTRGVAFSVVG
jgi:hypothetical protein